MEPDARRALHTKHAGSANEITDAHALQSGDPKEPHDTQAVGKRSSSKLCFQEPKFILLHVDNSLMTYLCAVI